MCLYVEQEDGTLCLVLKKYDYDASKEPPDYYEYFDANIVYIESWGELQYDPVNNHRLKSL